MKFQVLALALSVVLASESQPEEHRGSVALRDMFDDMSWSDELLFAAAAAPVWLLFRDQAAPPRRSSFFNFLWHGCTCRRRRRTVRQDARPARQDRLEEHPQTQMRAIEPSRQGAQLLHDARRNGTSDEIAPWARSVQPGACAICHVAGATRVFTGCGHQCICDECGDRMVAHTGAQQNTQRPEIRCPICMQYAERALPLLDAYLLAEMQSFSLEQMKEWEDAQFGRVDERSPETTQAYNAFTHVRDGLMRRIHANRIINPNTDEEHPHATTSMFRTDE